VAWAAVSCASASALYVACSPFSAANSDDVLDSGAQQNGDAAPLVNGDGSAGPDASSAQGDAAAATDACVSPDAASDGGVEILATGEYDVIGLAVDDTAVYWAAKTGGKVRMHSLCTGQNTDLFVSGKSPSTLAVSKGVVAVGDLGHGILTLVSVATGKSIQEIDTAAAPPTWLAHVPGVAGGAGAFVWTALGNPGSVNALADDGKGAPVLVSGAEANPWGIAADPMSGTVFWCDSSSSTIRQWSADAAPQNWVTNQNDCRTVAASLGIVWWVDFTAGTVHFTTSQGGDAPLSGAQSGPDGLVADQSGGAYWITRGNGVGMGTLVYGSSLSLTAREIWSGGSYATATGTAGYFQGLALDATYVYWVSYDDGVIRRMRKQ
jgi:hypothetical protein